MPVSRPGILVAVMPMMRVPPVPDPPEVLGDPAVVVDEEPQAAATTARTAVIATQRPLRNMLSPWSREGSLGGSRERADRHRMWLLENASGQQRLRVGMQGAGDAMPRRDLDKRWTVAGTHLGGVGATGSERAA